MLEKFVKTAQTATREQYFENYGEMERALEELNDILIQLPEKRRQEVLEEVAGLSGELPVWARIHLLSFVMQVSRDALWTVRLLDEVLQADYDDVGEYNKLSHYWQIRTAVFRDSELRNFEVELRLAQLYRILFDAFRMAVGSAKRTYIPEEERDEELVAVFTSQVLTLEHAPTKTLLDRCYILQKVLHKSVLIINTAMQITQKGAAPFYKLRDANYLPELSQRKTLEFLGESFEFIQCENNMPDMETISGLMQVMRDRKPYYIVNIGGSDICADICGMFIPEITISTVFSQVATSCGEYQIMGKKLTEQDEKLLHILDVRPEHVKSTLFTFSFKSQSHSYTREMLGLWKDKFILLVVGWRLDAEITDEFLEMLQEVVRREDKVGVAFMGKFEQYERRMLLYPVLSKHARNLGEQEDALAIVECCDLYVNPRRQGGGSSVAEAMYKGIPAMTLPTGDVAVAAGEEFWVDDYAKMTEQILIYASKPLYYQSMSEKAKMRAALLMDSNSSFGKIITEIEKEMC